MNSYACCVTGHREIPPDKMEDVKAKMEAEIEEAIADGIFTFFTGMAQGVDLLFAEMVIAQKAFHPNLILEAAIPYQKRLSCSDPQFQKCLAGCDKIYVQQREYSKESFLLRNRYMVNESCRVIGIYDGRERGGTFFTLRYARTMKREIRVIRI